MRLREGSAPTTGVETARKGRLETIRIPGEDVGSDSLTVTARVMAAVDSPVHAMMPVATQDAIWELDVYESASTTQHSATPPQHHTAQHHTAPHLQELKEVTLEDRLGLGMRA